MLVSVQNLFDLEGHDISPISPLNSLSISSFAVDVKGMSQRAKITSGSTLVAHSMGCLVALSFTISNPGLVENSFVGPPPSPLSEAASNGSLARAALAL